MGTSWMKPSAICWLMSKQFQCLSFILLFSITQTVCKVHADEDSWEKKLFVLKAASPQVDLLKQFLPLMPEYLKDSDNVSFMGKAGPLVRLQCKTQ